MLFLQFMLYSSSFVGTLVKNEIPEAALELCQLNINQVSPDILKFRTKHEDNQDNLFTLNCFVVSRSFLFIFHAGSRGLGSNNFRNSSYKEKPAGSARVSRLSFRFLWLWYDQISQIIKKVVFINSSKLSTARSFSVSIMWWIFLGWLLSLSLTLTEFFQNHVEWILTSFFNCLHL